MEMHYATLIEAIADRLGERTALVFGERRVSWQEFDDRAARVAAALTGAGLGPDSKVGLFLFNCAEYMEVMLGAMKMRAVPININYRYTADELEYLLRDSGAEALVFHASLWDRVAALRARLPQLKLLIAVGEHGVEPPDAPDFEAIIDGYEPLPRVTRAGSDHFMLYTGGTTGMPKGVVYRMDRMTAALGNLIARYFGLAMADDAEGIVARAIALNEAGKCFVSLPASPLMHTAGVMNGGIAMQLLGGTMVILGSRSFDARELWGAVERERVNYLVIVGDAFAKPMLKTLEDDAAAGRHYNLESLRTIVSSGVMWSADSKRRLLEACDAMLIDGMGATEGAMAVQIATRSQAPAETPRFQALPETRLFDSDDIELAPGCGKEGFIAIGSALLPEGYHGDAEKSARTFRTINGVRYGFTGDMGILEADGALTFLGRGSGCINTAGEKVFAEEVEEVLKAHPAVEDCLVVGIPDERFGQRVAAVVSLRSRIDDPLAALVEYGSSKLARYKLPRTLKSVERIVRGPNGKPDYKWARALLSEGA
jgi:acyl-CoA synthetase (AMP-forming)/AMP-acid ligase II